MRRRDARRQNNSIIVAMHHHDRADQARAHSPTRRPAKFLFAFAVLKLDPAGARKILSKKMRGAGLDGFPVLHHRFDRQCLHRAGKTFALGFFADENWNGQMIAHKTFVKIEN